MASAVPNAALLLVVPTRAWCLCCLRTASIWLPRRRRGPSDAGDKARFCRHRYLQHIPPTFCRPQLFQNIGHRTCPVKDRGEIFKRLQTRGLVICREKSSGKTGFCESHIHH